MGNLLANSKFSLFSTLFSLYNIYWVAIEIIVTGGSANYDFPVATPLFPSITGNFLIEWATIRAANMNLVCNPYEKLGVILN